MKEALQAEVGLPVDRDIPLIGFIGRLEEQKGSDILMEAIPKVAGENLQIIVLVSLCWIYFLYFKLLVEFDGFGMSSVLGNWQKGPGEAD